MSSTVINNHHENPVRSTSDRLSNLVLFWFFEGFFPFWLPKGERRLQREGKLKISTAKWKQKHSHMHKQSVRACTRTYFIKHTRQVLLVPFHIRYLRGQLYLCL